MTSTPAANTSLVTSSVTSRSTSDHYVMGAVIAVVGILSLAFNGFTLAVFARYRLLRTVNNWLVANLAISDLLYVITACVIGLSASVPGAVAWTAPLCRSTMPLMHLFYAVSGNACVLISFHRFASIVCPHRRVVVRRHSIVRLSFLLWYGHTVHRYASDTCLRPAYCRLTRKDQ